MSPAAFAAHLTGGVTTLCRCWRVARRDGVALTFTDHDEALMFDGQQFTPGDGLSARALEQTTGLAVDNTEALGVLSSSGVREADILAGLYDGAEVTAWLVDWTDPSWRTVQFRGEIGEIARAGGAFTAELRGLTEALNQPQGRVFQAPCSAVLGDDACRVDMGAPGLALETAVIAARGGRAFEVAAAGEDGWFARGTLRVLTGASAGRMGVVRSDRLSGATRIVEVWEALGAGIVAGDTVRLTAGCDRRFATCAAKFGNAINFQGFPHLPGEDWLMAYPKSAGMNDGGSLT